jgi:L-aspartate oxidase
MILSRGGGIVRDHDGLVQVISSLLPLSQAACPEADPALVALMVTLAALQRRESRGAHYRSDFPQPEPAFAQRSRMTWEAAQRGAEHVIAPFSQSRSA